MTQGFAAAGLYCRGLGKVASARPPRSLSAHSLADLPDFFRPTQSRWRPRGRAKPVLFRLPLGRLLRMPRLWRSQG